MKMPGDRKLCTGRSLAGYFYFCMELGDLVEFDFFFRTFDGFGFFDVGFHGMAKGDGGVGLALLLGNVPRILVDVPVAKK